MSKKRNRRSCGQKLNRQSKVQRRCRTASLGFESLESRQLLAAVSVSNTLDVVNAPDTTSISALMANDGGDGISLREAITAANNTSGSDTISFDASLSGSTLTLSQGQLAISSALTINGLGASQFTINADSGSRLFNVDNGDAAQVVVSISGLTLTGGNVTGDGGAISSRENLTVNNSILTGNQATGSGGAVHNYYATLNIYDSTISGNTAGSRGGGIDTYGGALGVTGSTISGNNAGNGGGIFIYGTGNISGSTISGNTATGNGGGIDNAFGPLSVSSSTISGNTAGNRGGGAIANDGELIISSSTVFANSASIGGGLATFKSGGDLILNDSIVAGSTGADIDHSGSSVTGSFNLIEDGSRLGDFPNTITGDPLLGPLADNGGPTLTHALPAGSPAIDAGNTTLTTDQRGLTRPNDITGIVNATGGNGGDIGAVERQNENPSLIVDLATDTIDATDGLTSLREAIAYAGEKAGADTITFDPSLTTSGDATIDLSMFDTGTDGGPAATSEFGPTAFIIRAEVDGNNELTIEGPSGPNGITIARNSSTSNFRLFHVQKNQSLTLANITLSGGVANGTGVSGQNTGGASAGMGGGIFNQGNLTIQNSLLSGNTANGAGNAGSAIYASVGASVGGLGSGPNLGASPDGQGGHGGGGGAASATTNAGHGGFGGGGGGGFVDDNIPASRPAGNGGFGAGGGIFPGGSNPDAISGFGGSGTASAGMGGAVFNAGGTFVITNSTVSGNSATGGISLGSAAAMASGMGAGVFSRNGSVTLTNTTFANQQVANGDASGAAIFLVADAAGASDDMGTGITAQIDNTIFADSNGGSDAALVNLNGGSSFIDGQNNIIETSGTNPLSLGLIHANADPQLAALADNGGPTLTHALLTGSPAIDAGLTPVLPFDQRGIGFLRSFGNVDVGAFEQQSDKTFTVTITGDELDLADTNSSTFTGTDISLREAIALSNYDPTTDDTIRFAGGTGEAFATGGTIRLTMGEIAITDAVTVDASDIISQVVVTGDAAGDDTMVIREFIANGFPIGISTSITNVSASTNNLADNSRIFNITSPTAATTINSLLLTGGRTTAADSHGGGVLTVADLTLVDSGVSGNSVAGANSDGGGIATTAGLRIIDSELAQNISGSNGGGIRLDVGSSLADFGSSMFGNSASSGTGGAIFALGNSNVQLTNTTLAANQANTGGALAAVGGTPVLLTNTTITGNSASTAGAIFGESNFNSLANSVILGNFTLSGDEYQLVGPATQTFTGPTIIGTNLHRSGSDTLSLGSTFTEVASKVFADTIDYINANGDAVKQPNELTSSAGSIAGNLTFSGGASATVALKNDSSNMALDAGRDDQLGESVVGLDLNNDGDTSDTISTDGRGSQRRIDLPEISNNGANRVDLGAYELQDQRPVFSSPTTASVTENTQAVHTLSAADDRTSQVRFRLVGQVPSGDLGPFGILNGGDSISSPDGSATLIMQASGNLVAIDNGIVVWASGTSGTGAFATMGSNGNLIVTDGDNTELWKSNSDFVDATAFARLHLADDGQPQVFRVDGAQMWTGTLGDTAGGGTILGGASSTLAAEFSRAADTDKFQIDTSDGLQFVAAPDFEAPTDANGDNVYEVSVIADDGNGGITPQTILVTVTDVNEPDLPGDYNLDGTVDAADYTVWRDALGSSVPIFTGADGDGDGTVTTADKQVWQSNYGATLTPPPALAMAAGNHSVAIAEPLATEAATPVEPETTVERGFALLFAETQVSTRAKAPLASRASANRARDISLLLLTPSMPIVGEEADKDANEATLDEAFSTEEDGRGLVDPLFFSFGAL